MKITPRPKQAEILAYRGGRMGVSAVPGSGKTYILSLLAAEIIKRGELDDDQEVLIVTLVNSAVDNFARRVGAFMERRHLIPNLGYRVRTLHGLAHDIVRERPDLAGLPEDFDIIDEHAADQIRQDAALAWLRANPGALDSWLAEELDDARSEWVRREKLPELVSEIALAFIRSAKDQRLTPELLRRQLESLPVPLPLAEMGCEIYTVYQQALLYRGAVDFDDLIRLALQALDQDQAFLDRLRYRWPYILEDEAQDSSLLQEKILSLLAGEEGNWVRVGDPNQAIFETFTTASPEHLRRFLASPAVIRRDMPNSGRSAQSIINLANRLIDWTRLEHPHPEARTALSLPHIEPAPPGDPQPNPPDDPRQIRLVARRFSPQEEIAAVVRNLADWLPENPSMTVAVLVPRNQRGFELVDELKRRRLPYNDSLLRSTTATRGAADALAKLVNYLADPGSRSKLLQVYKVWRRNWFEEKDGQRRMERVLTYLRNCDRVETYLWPYSDIDWLESLNFSPEEEWLRVELESFRQVVQRWQAATPLPIDQLVLSLSQDIFQKPVDLALVHKLALLMRQASNLHPDWRLPEFSAELVVIARNQRRFLGLSEEDTGIDPDKSPGTVFVCTVHKAKGLEWDRVYLMSVNNYDYPSGAQSDKYISEPWYIRDRLNLVAESLRQLEIACSQEDLEWYQEGEASAKARLDYVSERLRLLYVGITRARRELIVTWNNGRDGTLHPALPLAALIGYWEEKTC